MSCVCDKLASSIFISGRRNASVFPVPVGDSIRISFEEFIASIASSCIGLSASIPIFCKISS